MPAPPRRAVRRLGGWGFDGEGFPPAPELLAWLEGRLGPPLAPLPSRLVEPETAPAAELGELPVAVTTAVRDRLAHARGQGLADVVTMRSGRLPPLPDGVVRPTRREEVRQLLDTCSRRQIRLIPWGGGTSVTGGVNVVADQHPVVTVDLERMAGLADLDPVSGLATFGPGTAGPAVETALARHGLTLGHFPQSWELATVGGWVATRSSGQESLRYGRIEDLVAGLELVAPAGELELPARPASAAGPDLRQLVMGSEGALGVITEVTLRVRPRPPRTVVEAALTPDLESGLAIVREIVQADLPLAMVRLSDAPETQVAMAVGLGDSPVAGLARRWLALRGVGEDACLLLAGAAGTTAQVTDALAAARGIWRRHRAVSLGRRPGATWQRDRFRHPYLREALLDLGYATDTFETATTWADAAALRDRVRAVVESALKDEKVAVLCHVSHPYRDGTSLYFTFFFRCDPDPDATVARWARIKRQANAELVAAGATLSHHHGIGQWHAPEYPHEVGATGRDVIAAAARRLDPSRILAPWVLLDPADRLEA